MEKLLAKLLLNEQKLTALQYFKKYILPNCTKNDDGTYSCKDAVEFKNIKMSKFPVKFKRVEGDFYCLDCGLKTLEGAPEYIGGDFDCSGNKLTTLAGGPKRVGGKMECVGNLLTSLEGGPKYVGGPIYCMNNRFWKAPKKPGKAGTIYDDMNPYNTDEESEDWDSRW